MLIAWQAVVAAGIVVSIILLGQHKIPGWVVGIVADVVSAPYYVVTHQWPFVGLAAILASVSGMSWHRWHRRETRRTIGEETIMTARLAGTSTAG